MEALGEALAIVDFARAETRKRAPHLTHPLLCLDAVRAGIERGGRAGLRAVRVLHHLGEGFGCGSHLVQMSSSSSAAVLFGGHQLGGCAVGLRHLPLELNFEQNKRC